MSPEDLLKYADTDLERLAASAHPEDLDNLDSSRFGRVQRGGRLLHRCRAKDYRIYFERHPDGVLVHRVLHKNTIRDFLYRSNLPMDEEDEQLGGAKEFWKLIEEAEKKR